MALPHLLLLPGLACDAEVWKHQARSLGEIATVQVVDYGASDSIRRWRAWRSSARRNNLP